MKISMYSIYDRKSNEYWSPKVAVNDDSIKRDFAMMVNEPGTLVFGFPADFELYEVGSLILFLASWNLIIILILFVLLKI